MNLTCGAPRVKVTRRTVGPGGVSRSRVHARDLRHGVRLDDVRDPQLAAVLQLLDHRDDVPHALQRDRLAGGQRHRGIGELPRGDLPGGRVRRVLVRRERVPLVGRDLRGRPVDGQLRRGHVRGSRRPRDVRLALLADREHVRSGELLVDVDDDGLAVRGHAVEQPDAVHVEDVLAVRERGDRGELGLAGVALDDGVGIGHGTALSVGVAVVGLMPELSRRCHITMWRVSAQTPITPLRPRTRPCACRKEVRPP